MIKIFNSISIYKILLFSLLVRLSLFPFFSDTFLENEWGVIFHNFKISGILGYNVVINDYLAVPKLADAGQKVLPSVFMPPLYIFLIFVFEFFFSNFVKLTNFVIIFQIFLSLASIYMFYEILKIFEIEKKLVLILCSIFAFFPLNIYAALQISSVTLQIFLIVTFFLFLFRYEKNNNFLNLFLFSLASGLLILTRGEFFIFYILTVFYFFGYLKFRLKTIVISLIISTLIISPYLKRNYNNFDTLVLTKSFGYNLLKGNNPSFKVEGDSNFIEKNYDRENLSIEADNFYEIKLDNFYKTEAIRIIKNEPFEYFKFFFIKVFSFLLFDFNSTYPNYYNFFHLFPKILISLTCLFGAILALKKKGFYQYLALYYFSNIFLFSFFFILPRYSLILLPVQLILSLVFFNFLRKFFN